MLNRSAKMIPSHCRKIQQTEVTLFERPDSGQPDRCLVGISLILLCRIWSQLDVQVVVYNLAGDPFKAPVFEIGFSAPDFAPTACIRGVLPSTGPSEGRYWK
jgi:hypothetical protein